LWKKFEYLENDGNPGLWIPRCVIAYPLPAIRCGGNQEEDALLNPPSRGVFADQDIYSLHRSGFNRRVVGDEQSNFVLKTKHLRDEWLWSEKEDGKLGVVCPSSPGPRHLKASEEWPQQGLLIWVL
jgi:hypothetical protein